MGQRSLAQMLFGVLALALLIQPFAAWGQGPSAELLQRMQEVSQRAQQCGGNAACLSAVQREFEELNRQFAQSQGAQGSSPFTPEQQAREAALQKKVEQAIATRASDPCYDVYFQKEYARQAHGSDLPWLTCTPLEVRVRWELREQDGMQGYRADFTVDESYPANLQILRDQHDRSRIQSYVMRGPAPQNRAPAQARMVKGSAMLTGVRYFGIFASRPYEEKKFSASTSDFKVESGYGALDFDYGLDYGPDRKVISHRLTLNGPQVTVKIKRRDAELGEEFHTPSAMLDGDAGFSIKEIEEGLKTGRLEKTFSLNFEILKMQQSGRAVVTVLFDREPGRLAVTPDQGFESSGPDQAGNYQPSSKRYRVKNAGDTPLSWTAKAEAAWLDALRASGRLDPGESAQLEVRINDKARALDEGTHRTQIRFRNVTDGRGDTARPVTLEKGEEERWRLHITGYEADEFKIHVIKDNQWAKSQVGIRYNYKLWVDFTIRKRKGKWEYKEGKITVAEVGMGSLYDPSYWVHKRLRCENCDEVTRLKGTAIGGTVSEPKSVELRFRDIRARIPVEAKITVPCKPMPRCSEWGSNLYISDTFFHRMNEFEFPLQDGHTGNHKVETPSDRERWVNYDYSLRRLHPK